MGKNVHVVYSGPSADDLQDYRKMPRATADVCPLTVVDVVFAYAVVNDVFVVVQYNMIRED